MAFAVGAVCLAASLPVRAETPEETAFGLGQFIGAASFCGVPKDDVQAVADRLLTVSDIDSSKPGPEMDRFKAGVTAGVVDMRGRPSDCGDVKAAFADAKAKLL